MAIFSVTNKWQITLNRTEVLSGNNPEQPLASRDFTPSLTLVPGTGTIRSVVLGTRQSFLTPSEITIAHHDAQSMPGLDDYRSALVVTDVAPNDHIILNALNQIRQLLDVGITSTELPNAVIYSSVYLRKGELEVYESTGITSDADYDTKAAAGPNPTAFAERYRIATMYRTAALLVPALPDIVEQSTLRLRTRYTEIDWEKKIALLLKLADDIIEDDIVDPQITATVVAECITRTVRF